MGDSCYHCSAMALTAWYNGVDPLEMSDEQIPKVNRDYWHFFANLDILLYIHLLAEGLDVYKFLKKKKKKKSMCTCSTVKALLYSNASTRACAYENRI